MPCDQHSPGEAAGRAPATGLSVTRDSWEGGVESALQCPRMLGQRWGSQPERRKMETVLLV